MRRAPGNKPYTIFHRFSMNEIQSYDNLRSADYFSQISISRSRLLLACAIHIKIHSRPSSHLYFMFPLIRETDRFHSSRCPRGSLRVNFHGEREKEPRTHKSQSQVCWSVFLTHPVSNVYTLFFHAPASYSAAFAFWLNPPSGSVAGMIWIEVTISVVRITALNSLLYDSYRNPDRYNCFVINNLLEKAKRSRHVLRLCSL